MFTYIWRQTFIGAYYIMKNVKRDLEPGGRLILKMPSDRYRNSHYKDNYGRFIFVMVIPYLERPSLHWDRVQLIRLSSYKTITGLRYL